MFSPKKMQRFSQMNNDDSDKRRQNLEQENKRRLKGLNLSHVQTGSYDSQLNGVDTINVERNWGGDAAVYVKFGAGQGGSKELFRVTNQEVQGQVPHNLEIDESELKKEIIDVLKGRK